MNEEIQIVDATFKDAHAIGQIQIAGWLDSYASPEKGITIEDIQFKVKEWNQIGDKRIEDEFKKPGSRTWVTKTGGQVVGFIGGIKGEENRIEALYILPSYQGQGIGSKLLETALNWLGDSKKISIEVVSYNKGAIRLYKKFGFVEKGEVTDDVIVLPNGKIIPKILMVKN